MKLQTRENRQHFVIGLVMITFGAILTYAFSDHFGAIGMLLVALGGLYMIAKMH